MKTSRRKFIKNTSIAATGIAIGCSQLTAKKPTKVESCSQENYAAATIAPPPAATISSIKNGDWSDVTLWGGRLPNASDVVGVNHTVILDMDASIAGANIVGTLGFSPVTSCTLQTTKNIVVTGTLNMAPMNAAIGHTLRFTGINENNYVGGGMDVLDTDTGLWVMGSGQLDIRGAVKTGWTNCISGVSAGATSIGLQSTDGWNIGDEIAIAPTSAGDITGFDNRTITGKSGTTMTVAGTTYEHPVVNSKWTAEVMNLTRNVRIEGTASGRTHLFIRSTKSQTIKNVSFRYVGPRKNNNLVLGRYGMHFHHCMTGSDGSLVEGVVIRDAGNHSFVPHVSNGITFKNCIAYNVLESAYWWDEKDLSHDINYDNCIAGKVNFVPGSYAVDTSSPEDPRSGVSGFFLGMGFGNKCNNSLAIGVVVGDVGNGAGFNWEADNEGVWEFNNCTGHNNDYTIRVWQNTSNNHVIENLTMYHNRLAGIAHGAYANSYTYLGGEYYASTVAVEASSGTSTRVRFENITFNGAGLVDYGIYVMSSPIPAPYPTFIRGCSFTGFKVAGIANNAEAELKGIDVIGCSGVVAKILSTASSQEFIRIQSTSGQATRLTKSGTTNIAAFAPTIWGNGKGLKGEYFNSFDFTSKVVERIDSIIAFDQWGTTGAYHKITSNTLSVRWAGKIMPQYSSPYTFTLFSGGAVKLWVNNVQILNVASEPYSAEFTASPITLQAGQLYDIKLEYANTDFRNQIGLFWQCSSLAKEYVPQSQLYPDGTITQTPISDAGPDINITLPTSTVQLNGTATNGNPLWSKVSGGAATITSPTSAQTTVTGLAAGTYVFRLTVGSVSDDVTVTVNPQMQTATLTLTASPNPATVSQNWSIKASSSVGGIINLRVSNSMGTVLAQADVNSGTITPYGSGLARGTYILTATQGSVTKTLQLIKQ